MWPVKVMQLTFRWELHQSNVPKHLIFERSSISPLLPHLCQSSVQRVSITLFSVNFITDFNFQRCVELEKNVYIIIQCSEEIYRIYFVMRGMETCQVSALIKVQATNLASGLISEICFPVMFSPQDRCIIISLIFAIYHF